jgi:hypothetical protein
MNTDGDGVFCIAKIAQKQKGIGIGRISITD